MADESYAQLVKLVLEKGRRKPSRAGETLSVVGASVRAPVREVGEFYEIPLLTRKKVSFQNVATELQWFARGETSALWLEKRGVRIWSADADRAAERGFPQYAASRKLGPIYGAQWVRQMPAVIQGLRADPYGRRHIVCSWNVDEIPQMVMPPCHYSFQFVAQPEDLLSCVVTMRSGDVGLGIPYNIASYALLLCLVARSVGRRPDEVVINIADAHVYAGHEAQLREMMARPAHDAPLISIPAHINYENFASLGDGDRFDFGEWVCKYDHSGPLALQLFAG